MDESVEHFMRIWAGGDLVMAAASFSSSDGGKNIKVALRKHWRPGMRKFCKGGTESVRTPG